jgi:methionyl-tRNA synthetase
MSAGVPLPKRVFGHGFLTNRGEKMSKSVGNVIDPFDLVTTYGVDPVRFFFLREVAFGQDGSYSADAIETRLNADLANGLGNLAQRCLSMIAKGFDGKVPAPGPFTESDRVLLAAADALYPAARAAMNSQAIKVWLDAVWDVIGQADRYFASEKPFDKTLSVERKGTILYVTAEVVRQLAILAQPAMPRSAEKLLGLLAQPADRVGFAHLGEAGRLVAGTVLPPPVGVFPRYVRPEPDASVAPAKAPKKAKPAKDGKPGKGETA